MICALDLVIASMDAAGVKFATATFSEKMWEYKFWDLPEGWGLGSWSRCIATSYPKRWQPLENRKVTQWEISVGAGLLK